MSLTKTDLLEIEKIVENVVDRKLDEKLDVRFAEFEAKIDAKLDAKLQPIYLRLDNIEGKLQKLDEIYDIVNYTANYITENLEPRVKSLESQMSLIQHPRNN